MRKQKNFEMMDDIKKTLSSRHNRTNAHMNSQRLWQYTSPVEVEARRGPGVRHGNGHELSSLTMKISCDHHTAVSQTSPGATHNPVVDTFDAVIHKPI